MSKTTAWRYYKRYLEDPEGLIPIKQAATKKPGPQTALTKEHTQFIISLMDRNPLTTAIEIHDALLSNSKSREDEFLNKSVFIDEAGFNLQTLRSVGWAPKNERAAVEVPNHKGVSIAII
ncbi:hypothetical protein BGZ99_000434, partial [Dissophora globulifera]